MSYGKKIEHDDGGSDLTVVWMLEYSTVYKYFNLGALLWDVVAHLMGNMIGTKSVREKEAIWKKCFEVCFVE